MNPAALQNYVRIMWRTYPWLPLWAYRSRRIVDWEYRKIDLNLLPRKGDDIDVLCDAGEDGWELVTILPNSVAYLKRERIESAGHTERSHAEDEPERTSEV